MKDFLKLLIGASEKAGNIARIIRSDPELLKLLIEEKTDEDKNTRFFQDFKTLADVLIQESLRHDISAKYPEMADNIYGEENNTFSNASGESITVKVEETPEKTAELLSRVLANDSKSCKAAKLLAEEVHREMQIEDKETSEVPDNLIDSFSDIGIWIDPIDGTNEYIKGSEDFDIAWESGDLIWPAGLHCVTVLIGAFDIQTGQPLVGVVNQPFWRLGTSSKSWQGRYFYGGCVKDQVFHSNIPAVPPKAAEARMTAIISGCEDPDITKKLAAEKFGLVSAAGAGYKVLCVIIGLADLYALSKDSTHFWDTCGPHAILKSIGGGIIDFKDFAKENTNQLVPDLESSLQLSYGVNEQKLKDHFRNSGGVLAYRDKTFVEELGSCLT